MNVKGVVDDFSSLHLVDEWKNLELTLSGPATSSPAFSIRRRLVPNRPFVADLCEESDVVRLREYDQLQKNHGTDVGNYRHAGGQKLDHE